ncbi:preprotein translocase subunit SecG [Synechococcus sp. O70.2]|jgi:preprotein translocase subunit SecG|uniref:preprotein translocase subunit SecG n=1 Tax=unclassified Synechococcus TaxID=2626047 RepID=UPI0039C2C085
MEAFFEFLWSASAILLVILVLLHSPKGDGLAAISGQAQLFASPKSAEQNLNRLTWTVATLFLSISVVLGAGWLSTGAGQ